jgi:hypothetical protein
VFTTVSYVCVCLYSVTRIRKVKPCKMAEIEELLDVSSNPFILFLSARLTRSCRNFVFWHWFKYGLLGKMELVYGKNGTKIAYDLHSYWTSISAVWLASHRANDWSSCSRYLDITGKNKLGNIKTKLARGCCICMRGIDLLLHIAFPPPFTRKR